MRLNTLASLGVADPLAPRVAVGLDLQALRLAQPVFHGLPCKHHPWRHCQSKERPTLSSFYQEWK